MTAAKLILAASGLITWGYGIRSGVSVLKWLGIAMLASAALLRFVKDRDLNR